MKTAVALCLSLSALVLSQQVAALAMGEEDFAASRRLTCVLAQESLGYLSEEEYGDLTLSVLDGYDQSEADVIYAKAIGYFDGLMFGLGERDQRGINARLQAFVKSRSCTTGASLGLEL